jgi:hypothetical protein
MNSKHYVGKRVSSLEFYDEIGPITGVAMILDDENEIFSGDESGYVLEMECPYATQEMADAVLAQVSGGVYRGYRAPDASLSVDAELGDGVTVNGVYSMLAYQRLNFGPGHLSEIAAPGENVVDHEYPYLSPSERKDRREKAQIRSAIEKTSEEILLKVEGIDKGFTELKVTLDGVTITDPETGVTRIKGSSIETGSLVLTGSITWSDLDSEVQSNILSGGGISSEQVRTIITSTLVSSPNIQGANYWSGDRNTWMNLLSLTETTYGIGGGIEIESAGWPIFSAKREASLNAQLSSMGTSFLMITANGWVHPLGNWDFQLASDVTGVPAVFG